uniref:Uncharacterized protein n=1 Tax=Esox lucius TaxID=8010 RepID=A0A6Q2YRP4_ESOLU
GITLLLLSLDVYTACVIREGTRQVGIICIWREQGITFSGCRELHRNFWRLFRGKTVRDGRGCPYKPPRLHVKTSSSSCNHTLPH